MPKQPNKKKAKIIIVEEENNGNNKAKENELLLQKAAETAWEHYRNYQESLDEAGGGGGGGGSGDTDELEELLGNDVLQPFMDSNTIIIKPLKSIDDIICMMSLLKDSSSSSTNNNIKTSLLLPILISVSYYHLADIAIGECLEFKKQKQNEQKIQDKASATEEEEEEKKDNNENDDDTTSQEEDEEQLKLIMKCQQLIEKSIYWYPENAAMWSMGANFGRMFQLLSPSNVCIWYENAVKYSTKVKNQSLKLLENENNDNNATSSSLPPPPEVKEWIELLLLNQVAGVEYVFDDDDDEEEEVGEVQNNESDTKTNDGDNKKRKLPKDDDDDDDDDDQEKEEGEKEEEQEEEGGYFSTSSVEGTARFMAAMLHSTSGQQNKAKQHLQYFDITHRVHPNIWQPTTPTAASPTTAKTLDEDNNNNNNRSNSIADEDQPQQVTKYISSSSSSSSGDGGGGEGIIPTKLYNRLCQVFAPNAVYWKESDYDHRGYYSYYMDKPPSNNNGGQERGSSKSNTFKVNNLIDDVIWNHLYKLVERQLKDNNDESTIVGAEWWVHTRAIQANLGHNLHFDTDEALLAQEEQITHPKYSSVLYLTGGELGGPTVVFDQTPDSTEVADKAWRCTPQDNTLLIFNGELLHGVLPCPGRRTTTNKQEEENGDNNNVDDNGDDNTKKDKSIQEQWIRPVSRIDKKDDNSMPHRLTLLVGFWTRRVPDKMKNRKLYGPCGPMPPRPSQNNNNKEEEKEEQQHTWVEEIHQGYDDDSTTTLESSPDVKQQDQSKIITTTVPVVTPAWEKLYPMSYKKKDNNTDNDDSDQKESTTSSSAEEASLLEIPRGIDHRFFVKDAPKCFRDSLFEKNDDDNCDGEVDVDEMDDVEESEK